MTKFYLFYKKNKKLR